MIIAPRVLCSMAIVCLALGACDRPPDESAGAGARGSAGRAAVPAAPAHPEPPPVEQLPRVDGPAIKALVAESAALRVITLIDFWATWCAPCVEMFEPLHDELAAFGEEVRLVTVTQDEPKDEPRAISFLHKHHALADAYMLTLDEDAALAVPGEIGQKWQSLVIPAVLVFDRGGELTAEFGAEPETPAEVDAIVEHVKGLVGAGGR